MLAGLGQIELLTRLVSHEGDLKDPPEARGRCEDLQELGDPPEPEDSPEPELRGRMGSIRPGGKLHPEDGTYLKRQVCPWMRIEDRGK